jgi:hypothetical protein
MRPFEHLPYKLPADFDPGPKFFYDNFVSQFIPDIIEMMNAGIHIDEEAVENLRSTVTEVLNNVDCLLLRNTIIQQYQELKAKGNQKAHYKKHTQAVKTAEDCYKDYNQSDMIHRTWVVNEYLNSIECQEDKKEQWSVKDLKNYNVYKEDSVIAKILDKSIAKKAEVITAAMNALAQYKADLWNKPRYDKANSKASVEPFNAGSAKQKQELFDMLNIEPLAHSDKTGDGSWGREYIEQLKKETPEDREILHEILDCIIDHSYGSIIRNNFLKSFDTYTIDGVLHGNVKLFGAKSFRPTSNGPNLLNMPSTKSVYASPLKKCFIAPKTEIPEFDRMLVIQCDYASLEDVVLAAITLDEGKLAVQKDKTLDAHCYNAMGYFTQEIEDIIGSDGGFADKVRRFKIGVADKNKQLIGIRQKSKPITFKLAYLGYPDAHKGGVITQEIFDNYHNVLYPDVRAYLENYVKPITNQKGYLHLGLGCRLYSDDVEADFRTLFNATFQFWSILTLIAVNELNYRIKKAGLQDEIILCSTIYDSIYTYISPDSEVIKWYNDNVVQIGKKDFIPNQQVLNSLECGIGRNWSEEIAIPPNASIIQIEEILENFKKV